MAFSSTITNLVNTAFNVAGDLAEDVTFVNESTSGYNFSTGVATTTSTSVTIKGIVTAIERPDGANPYISANITFRSSDVGELDIYDSATFRGRTWKLKTFNDNGYAVEAVLSREV